MKDRYINSQSNTLKVEVLEEALWLLFKRDARFRMMVDQTIMPRNKRLDIIKKTKERRNGKQYNT